MTLNFISKHGIIIAVVTILGCLATIVAELPRIIYMLTVDDDHNYYSPEYVMYSIGIIIVIVISVIFSILMIVGIVKKRHMLLTPWLVVGFLSSVIVSCTIFYDTVTRTRFRANDLFSLFLFIGLQVIIMYPICNLYFEIRRENTTAEPKEFESNYTCNIQNACQKVSKKTIV